MAQNRKRQRLDEGGSSSVVGQEWKINDSELKSLLGDRKYVEEQDLTRDILLACLCRSNAVEKVSRFPVKVTTLSSDAFEVKVDNTENHVWQIKKVIEEQQGFKTRKPRAICIQSAREDSALI